MEVMDLEAVHHVRNTPLQLNLHPKVTCTQSLWGGHISDLLATHVVHSPDLAGIGTIRGT